MFDRLISLVGEEKFKKISEAHILLIGLGGVGGYVAEALARSGVGFLTIIDGDVIDETNINRQIIALHSTIGQSKIDVFKKRILDINPDCQIETLDKFIKEEDIPSLKMDDYEYVVDAIDDLQTKIVLAKYCLGRGINLVVATGTAKKMYPEKLEITTLNKTSYDPLARRMRSALRDYDTARLSVLASKESPVQNSNQTLGSFICVPATGGLLIANHIIHDLIK